MDFTHDEDLLAVQELAREIFTDKADDEALWEHLARAGLVGIGLPEAHGGAGLGLDGLCVVLEEQGRCVAPVPLWSAGVAALAVAEYGELPPGVADGSARLTLALEEFDGNEPALPRCTATADGLLTGAKAVVPSPFGASHLLVSATGPDGPAVFLVPTDGPGVTWERTEITSQEPAGNLTLDGAQAERLGGADALASVLRMAAVAVAALQVGVAEGALRLAASYTSTREQFGRPLATFQSLQHQLADCLIDIDAMRVTLWQALTALADQGPVSEKERAVLVAKWWSAHAGLDVVHRVQHVHGGIGVDTDYPVHRYFLWGKQLATTLGGSAAALAGLGEEVAR
ncbi:acyl-CoA dehydrogenase family protein [Nocardioides speluncae]|uniref:acyl-CoA dehydrogenase family protein n=1 Tax=Nocardioides speluncae TaxID=2670337 RepID=UPI000D69E43B|nr:acyl-CoA dehydrogenase family protein [Nocardioides speluncae]